MNGYAGAVWPVIVRRWIDRWEDSPKAKYVYQYPERFFRNLRHRYDIFLNAEKKPDRLVMLKYLVDELMDNKIDIHLYHFGMYLLYPYASRKQEEDAEAVGKKRSKFISHLPRFELKSNDEFVSEVRSDLILRRYPEVGEEIVTVPSFSQLRILFTADNFGITPEHIIRMRIG